MIHSRRNKNSPTSVQQQQRYKNSKGQQKPIMPPRSRSENPINRSKASGAFTYLPTAPGTNTVILNFLNGPTFVL